MSARELTPEMIQTIFEYNPDTGVVRWRVGRGKKIKAGDIAGSSHPKGYLQIKYDGVNYLYHRVAWACHYGSWPDGLIDHVNLDGTDNRISNLRQASFSENQYNKCAYRNSKTGLKGVTWYEPTQRYRAVIRFNKKQISLGYFRDIEDARAAYENAARLYHGDFWRVG